MIYVQARMLNSAPDMLNRVMSGESCFRTDTVGRCEFSKKIISCGRLKNRKHLVSAGLSCSDFSFYEHFNRHMQFFYIQNRWMCLSKKILCQYFWGFFALLGTASPLKTFYMSLHSTKNVKKIDITPDSLN